MFKKWQFHHCEFLNVQYVQINRKLTPTVSHYRTTFQSSENKCNNC
jgi:hypothetical protein